jgi:glutathione-regulated potassium-efflux system ancillary protein KefC
MRHPSGAGRYHARMEHGPTWIHASLIYLGAAVLAVPLARLLGLGAIIGYLAAGIAIGPWGLKLVTDPQAMLHFAEFGVVLMLFLVGLELEPRRLWQLRRPIFGWGSVQMAGGDAADAGRRRWLAGVDWRLALVAGLGLSLSSTAIGLAVLNERNLMATSAGQSVLSVALLQDIAAIPILAIVPLLAVQGSGRGRWRQHGWLGCGQGLRRDRGHRLRRPAAAAPGAALDRTQRHARDLHRRRRCCWWWPPRR